MKFLALIPFLAVSVLAVAIAEPEAYADAGDNLLDTREAYADDSALDSLLETRAVNCKKIVRQCPKAVKIKGANCRCKSQKAKCGLWACPRGKRVSPSPRFSI